MQRDNSRLALATVPCSTVSPVHVEMSVTWTVGSACRADHVSSGKCTRLTSETVAGGPCAATCEPRFDSFCRCVGLLPSRKWRFRSRLPSAGRNLKSFEQIGHRRVETPCADLQRYHSRLVLATFNVRQVSPVHVEVDGEIICGSRRTISTARTMSSFPAYNR
jgi:hypothetical protein